MLQETRWQRPWLQTLRAAPAALLGAAQDLGLASGTQQDLAWAGLGLAESECASLALFSQVRVHGFGGV